MNKMDEKMAKLFQETLDRQRLALKVPGISAAVIQPDDTTWLGVSGMLSGSKGMGLSALWESLALNHFALPP